MEVFHCRKSCFDLWFRGVIIQHHILSLYKDQKLVACVLNKKYVQPVVHGIQRSIIILQWNRVHAAS